MQVLWRHAAEGGRVQQEDPHDHPAAQEALIYIVGMVGLKTNSAKRRCHKRGVMHAWTAYDSHGKCLNLQPWHYGHVLSSSVDASYTEHVAPDGHVRCTQ